MGRRTIRIRRNIGRRCLPWESAIWFGIPYGQSGAPLHFSGRLQAVDRDRVVLSARGRDGFVLRTPQNFGTYGVVVGEGWLRDEMTRLGLEGRAPQARWPASVHAACLSPHRHAALRQTIESMLSLGALDDDDAFDRQATLRRLSNTLLAQPLNHTLSVDDLCEQLHLNPRTLQNHFRTVVGDSPGDHLRAVRLIACRRRLRMSTVAKAQDIAAQ